MSHITDNNTTSTAIIVTTVVDTEPTVQQIALDLNAIGDKVRKLQRQVTNLYDKQEVLETSVEKELKTIRAELAATLLADRAWKEENIRQLADIIRTLETIKVTIVGDAVSNVTRWQMSYKVIAGLTLAVITGLMLFRQDIGGILVHLGTWIK
jgi:hypothetical protein